MHSVSMKCICIRFFQGLIRICSTYKILTDSPSEHITYFTFLASCTCRSPASTVHKSMQSRFYSSFSRDSTYCKKIHTCIYRSSPARVFLPSKKRYVLYSTVPVLENNVTVKGVGIVCTVAIYTVNMYIYYERYRGKVSSALNVNRMLRQKSWFRGEADEMVETSRIRYTADPSQLKLVIHNSALLSRGRHFAFHSLISLGTYILGNSDYSPV